MNLEHKASGDNKDNILLSMKREIVSTLQKKGIHVSSVDIIYKPGNVSVEMRMEKSG